MEIVFINASKDNMLINLNLCRSIKVVNKSIVFVFENSFEKCDFDTKEECIERYDNLCFFLQNRLKNK